ncbi:regenerating islet-derived protein 4-like [Mobula birostris]|uniref:regenerating islet-derived protein 4-like n=1 Tax=Mobula birostris TaxID=1983395 RepID=UPI003B28C68D
MVNAELAEVWAKGDKGKPSSSAEENGLFKREVLIQGRCDPGWFYYRTLNYCSRYFREKRSWEEAQILCNIPPHYGKLASVRDNNHNSFISKVISRHAGQQSAWIGLNDISQEGTFKWVDGVSSSYRNWRAYEPNVCKSYGDCVLIRSASGGDWDDVSCDEEHGFVCSYIPH